MIDELQFENYTYLSSYFTRERNILQLKRSGRVTVEFPFLQTLHVSLGR